MIRLTYFSAEQAQMGNNYITNIAFSKTVRLFVPVRWPYRIIVNLQSHNRYGNKALETYVSTCYDIDKFMLVKLTTMTLFVIDKI